MDDHQGALQGGQLYTDKRRLVGHLFDRVQPRRTRLKRQPTQTESERSLLPTAQQQYGQLGFGALPFFCFFLKIFGLNFWEDRKQTFEGGSGTVPRGGLNPRGLTTTVTAFLWPTKSMFVFQPSLSTICAVGPELFMAWADTRYWPSGDHDRRRTCVVPPHWDTEGGTHAHVSLTVFAVVAVGGVVPR